MKKKLEPESWQELKMWYKSHTEIHRRTAARLSSNCFMGLPSVETKWMIKSEWKHLNAAWILVPS